MKKLLLFIAVLMFSSTADAQIVSSSSRKVVEVTANRTFKDYDFLSFAFVYGHDKFCPLPASDFLGANVGYTHGFSISNSIPLYVETGANAQFATSDDEYSAYTNNHLCLYVPVRISYRLRYKDFYVAPFAGARVTYNLMRNAFPGRVNKIQGVGEIGLNLGYRRFNLQIAWSKDITNICQSNSIKLSKFMVGLGINIHK
ncbi:MAG: hypothetical protein Q4E60_11300 [Bacteroidales bacterium]|nr:hypothetical protein [Bacteroidales bacterium]